MRTHMQIHTGMHRNTYVSTHNCTKVLPDRRTSRRQAHMYTHTETYLYTNTNVIYLEDSVIKKSAKFQVTPLLLGPRLS